MATKNQPQTPKLKVYAIIGVLVLGIGWIGYQLRDSSLFKSGPVLPSGPEWDTSKSVTATLKEDPKFFDVEFAPDLENPGRFVVVGTVRGQANLDALRKSLETIRPENDYDVRVEVIGSR